MKTSTMTSNSKKSIKPSKLSNNNLIAYLLVLPTLIYLAIFQLYPLIESIRLSFTDLNYLKPGSGSFVGLKNYKELLFHDSNLMGIIGNSFMWVILSSSLKYLIVIPVAVILNQKLKFRSLWRGIIMVPWVIPVVIMGLIWKWILDGDYGLLNFYLGTDIVWFGQSTTAWASLLLASLWSGFPFATIMVLSGLQTIPQELIEASYVDGSGKFKSFFKITLPLLLPILAVSTMISIVMTWTKFEVIWVLTAGGPGLDTSILPTYIYTKAFREFDMGLGSAVAVISMVVMVIFIILYFIILKERQSSRGITSD